MDEIEQLGCVFEWKQGSYVVKVPDPAGSGVRLTLFVVSREGYFYLGWLPYQLERVKLDAQLGFEYVRSLFR